LQNRVLIPRLPRSMIYPLPIFYLNDGLGESNNRRRILEVHRSFLPVVEGSGRFLVSIRTI
jgi:hypothetical protein